MVLDFSKDGKLIGIEIIDPQELTLQAINEVLEQHGFAPLSERELAPILAA